MQQFNQQRERIARSLVTIIANHPQIAEKVQKTGNTSLVIPLKEKVLQLKKDLDTIYRDFVQISYHALIGRNDSPAYGKPEIREQREQFVQYFKSVIQSDTEKCFNIIDDFLSRCEISA